MTRTTIFTIICTAIVAFALGWILHRSGSETAAQMVNISPASIQPAAEPDVVTVADTFSGVHHFPNEIRGRFYLDGTQCAGYNFISNDLVLQFNESACISPDTFRLHRISPSSFYLRDIKQIRESCPPRVWIYSIKFYDGKRLVLRWYNTSWTNGTDEDESFHSETVHKEKMLQ